MNTSVTSSTSSDDLSHDFDFAQSELISEDDYIQEALNCVERQHADDKEGSVTIVVIPYHTLPLLHWLIIMAEHFK